MGFRFLVQYVRMHLVGVHRADYKGSFRQRQIHQEQNESLALLHDDVLSFEPDYPLYIPILRRRTILKRRK